MNTQISDDAIALWVTHFPLPEGTFRFGGEGTRYVLTDRARKALEELLEHGYAEVIDADEGISGREHYGSTELSLRQDIDIRSGGDLDSWLQNVQFAVFENAGSDAVADAME